MNIKLTPEKLTAFCAALAETGVVARACKAVGISRQTAYEWKDEIPEFADAWERALKISVSAMEDEARRRACEGVDKPLTHQGQFTYLRDYSAIDPDTGQPYPPMSAPILTDADGNPRVATMKEYSDTLLIFLLKAHDPEKYRENMKVDLTGRLEINNMTDDEIQAELAALGAAGILSNLKPSHDDGDVSDLI